MPRFLSPPSGNIIGYDLYDVKPGNGRSLPEKPERLMRRVCGTNGEVGTNACDHFSKFKRQSCCAFPIEPRNKVHVIRKGKK